MDTPPLRLSSSRGGARKRYDLARLPGHPQNGYVKIGSSSNCTGSGSGGSQPFIVKYCRLDWQRLYSMPIASATALNSP